MKLTKKIDSNNLIFLGYPGKNGANPDIGCNMLPLCVLHWQKHAKSVKFLTSWTDKQEYLLYRVFGFYGEKGTRGGDGGVGGFGGLVPISIIGLKKTPNFTISSRTGNTEHVQNHLNVFASGFLTHPFCLSRKKPKK